MKNMKKKYIVSIIAAVIVFVMAAGIYILYPRPLIISVEDITVTNENIIPLNEIGITSIEKDVLAKSVRLNLKVSNPNFIKVHNGSSSCIFENNNGIIIGKYGTVPVHPYELKPRIKDVTCQYWFLVNATDEMTDEEIISELEPITVKICEGNASTDLPRPISNEVYLKVDESAVEYVN